MATTDALSVIDRQAAPTRAVESGTESIMWGPALGGSSMLTVYRRTVDRGKQLRLQSATDYQLLYIARVSGIGAVLFGTESNVAEPGAGVLLSPGEVAQFDASGGELELLHLVVPKPPAAIEGDLPGGPGYFFNRKTLRALTDASGGRIRRFCAESSVRRRDGQRLTPTNAIQAGEMHYRAGGGSPYHVHAGTNANPMGAAHCYITLEGRGSIEVDNESLPVEADALVYIPTGVPHRFRAEGGPLDYFEIQAWRSFKTTVLSEEPLGLKWFYERESPADALVEWNQS